jgi:hypothetical protein
MLFLGAFFKQPVAYWHFSVSWPFFILPRTMEGKGVRALHAFVQLKKHDRTSLRPYAVRSYMYSIVREN